MLKRAMSRALAGLSTLALATGITLTTPAFAANAVTAPDDKCIVDVIHHDEVDEVSHQEYQYEKTIPGQTETFHNEYRYSRTATIYTVEHKAVKYTGTNSTVLAWLNANGTEGPTDVWTLNDSVVNGAGVNPLAPGIFYDGPFSPDHTVSLNAYGGPNVSVQYTITGVDWGLTVPPTPFYSSHTVTLYYTGSGDGSVTLADAIYVQTPPGAPWSQFGAPKSVSNGDGTPPTTVYYLTGGATSTTLTDANWTVDDPATVGGSWTLINQRKVVDVEAKDAYDEYVYGECPTKTCESASATWLAGPGDAPPTFVSNGLEFSGASIPGISSLHSVTGNLMGVIGSSYTIADASGTHAALIYFFNRFGTTGPATIVIEPTLNGWTPGQTGTFVVTTSTKVWSSEIPTGLGSQSDPATIAQLSALFPDNALIAQGLRLDAGSASGQFTVVSKVSGCGNVTFLAPPNVSCLANAVDDDLVLPAVPGVLWKVNGGTPTAGPVTIPLTSSDVTVEAVPATPAHLFGPGQTVWTFDAGPDGLCQNPTLAQFPTNVTSTDETCVAGKVASGTITVGMVGGVPFFTNEVDYFLDGSLTPMSTQTVAVKAGVHKVTAAPHDPDDTLIGDTSWDVTIKAASSACGDLTTLAISGSSSAAPTALTGALLLAAGLAVGAVHVARRPEREAE